MRLTGVGLKYTTTPLEVRERLAFSPQQTLNFLSCLPSKVSEAALLSTCNRTEIYAVIEGEGKACQEIVSWLASAKGLSAEELRQYFYCYQDEEVVRHLFWVVSGLDSMVFGEEQIQGQVKRALELSLKAKSAKRLLSFLFREALRVGKRLRRETELGSLRVSVGGLALEIAEKQLGRLDSYSLLIISAGETAQLVGKIAQLKGFGKILVTSRNFSRAQSLSQKLGGRAIPFEQLPSALTQTDVVVSATSAPHLIINTQMVRDIVASRNHRPLLLVDLAVPRDIDPRVRDIDGVKLYDLDDLLQEIKNEGDRMRIIEQAQALIEEEVNRTSISWKCLVEVVPIIKVLRKRAEEVRIKELRKTLKKLHLSEEGKKQLDILTCSLVNKLLHYPVVKLKEKPERATFFKEIFDLHP